MYHKIVLMGVLVSMLYTELTGLSAGLIIPGYFVLCLQSPLRILYTVVLALAALGTCMLLSRVMILYGRRRFVLLLVLTFAMDTLLTRTGLLPGGFDAIGVLVPGILAREMDRQGIKDALLSVVITTLLLALLAMLLGFRVLGV